MVGRLRTILVSWHSWSQHSSLFELAGVGVCRTSTCYWQLVVLVVAALVVRREFRWLGEDELAHAAKMLLHQRLARCDGNVDLWKRLSTDDQLDSLRRSCRHASTGKDVKQCHLDSKVFELDRRAERRSATIALEQTTRILHRLSNRSLNADTASNLSASVAGKPTRQRD